MCGIAGIWNRNGEPIDVRALDVMACSMRHRGPDDSGSLVDGDFGVSHVRMSIIDLSAGGSQPMTSADGRYTIIYNGEIHNYIELRAELQSAGHHFRSSCDTEVALVAFQHWGDDCFDRFNGMWAMAIWDHRKRVLLLCRDRFGIKPLYYSLRGNRLAFASEAKALTAAFPGEYQPDFRQLYGYLAAEVTDYKNQTFFKNISVLNPGTMMRIKRDSKVESTFWAFRPGKEEPSSGAADEFRSLLFDATRIRLRSDVPVSTWLSGGLDSSVIARIIRQLTSSTITCYSLRYPGWQYDESEYASSVADEPDRYHMHWVTPSKDQLFDTIDRLTWHHDAPAPMRGRYAMWHLANVTAKNAKVVITGDGSDELFGGYGTFMAPYLLDRIRRSVPAGRKSSSVLAEFRHLREVRNESYARSMRTILTPILYRMGIHRLRRPLFMTRNFEKAHGYWDAAEHQAGWACRTIARPYRSALNNATWNEFTSRGLPEMLHGFDATPMAHTLEPRSPFLDHRVVEFCFSLTYDEKMRDGFTKSILRRAFADMLPRQVLNRRRKLGFQSPVAEWLSDQTMAGEVRDRLIHGLCARQGILDPTQLEKHLDSRDPGTGPGVGVMIWRWLNMEAWLSAFFSGRISDQGARHAPSPADPFCS